MNSSQFYPAPFLTNTALADLPPGLIGDKIFPERVNGKQTGILPEIDKNKQLLRIRDLKSSPGVDFPMIRIQVDKTKTFYCDKYELGFPITDEDKASADPETNLALNGARYVVEVTKRYAEKQLADALVAEYVTPASADYTATPGTKWDASGGTPLADISAKISVIEGRTGITPSSLALDIQVLRGIFKTTEVQNRIIQTLPPAQQPGTELQQAQVLATMLGIEEVIVAKNCFYNTAGEDATKSLSNIWGEYVFLFHKESPRIGFKGTGLKVAWNGSAGGIKDGIIVKTVRDELHETDVVKAIGYWEWLICDKDTGFMWSNTLT
jgi:hypothetical protein